MTVQPLESDYPHIVHPRVFRELVETEERILDRWIAAEPTGDGVDDMPPEAVDEYLEKIRPIPKEVTRLARDRANVQAANRRKDWGNKRFTPPKR